MSPCIVRLQEGREGGRRGRGKRFDGMARRRGSRAAWVKTYESNPGLTETAAIVKPCCDVWPAQRVRHQGVEPWTSPWKGEMLPLHQCRDVWPGACKSCPELESGIFRSGGGRLVHWANKTGASESEHNTHIPSAGARTRLRALIGAPGMVKCRERAELHNVKYSPLYYTCSKSGVQVLGFEPRMSRVCAVGPSL